MPELVECHSGYDYAGRPKAIHWRGKRLEITDIIKGWRSPGEKCFRVRIQDGQEFDVCYDELRDAWRIVQV